MSLFRSCRVEEDEELIRPFPRIDDVETMELVVALVHPDHTMMFELLAATGLRRSELLTLESPASLPERR